MNIFLNVCLLCILWFLLHFRYFIDILVKIQLNAIYFMFDITFWKTVLWDILLLISDLKVLQLSPSLIYGVVPEATWNTQISWMMKTISHTLIIQEKVRLMKGKMVKLKTTESPSLLEMPETSHKVSLSKCCIQIAKFAFCILLNPSLKEDKN